MVKADPVARRGPHTPAPAKVREAKSRKRNFEKAGTVRIPWYRSADGRTFVDGRRFGRKLKAYTDHDEAVRDALRLAIEINGGGVEVLALTTEDRAIYAQATAEAMRRGRDLPGAITEWGECTDKVASEVPSKTMREVLSAGIEVLRRPIHCTATVADQLIAAKASNDHDGRYLKQLKRHWLDFASAFPGELRAITPDQIQAWIAARKRKDGEPLSANRRNHVRDDIIQLFKAARANRVLPDEATSAQLVPAFGARSERRRRKIEVFTVAEMRLLLAHTEHEWLPWVAIAGFSGLRPEEIARSYHAAKRKDTVRWEDFDWDEGEIIVREEVDKNGIARRCPIHENLRTWLQPWRDAQATGHVVTGSLQKFKARLKRRLLKFADGTDKEAADMAHRIIRWPHDVLRHSSATYRMAETGRNVHLVAAEFGNSPGMIRNHYDKVGPRSHGKAWYSITRGSLSNVIEVQLSLFREAQEPAAPRTQTGQP
jgi:hypothetical protein